MATIRSRCCAYSLAPVAEEVCAAYLKKHFPKEPEAARYAALFGGKIGSAKRCLEDAAGRTLLLDALKLAGLAEKQDVYGALALLSKYEKDRAGTQALLGLLLNVCSASLRGSEAAQSPVSPARAARCAGEAGKTARLLAGNVSGSRMDLETFVQRYYLERILYAANRRFQEMSAGQFEFRMYDLEKAGEGKNRGLDLMVYSAVTGKVREVRTLSGGESFMAALSLALGMADQIQESSAAVNLDMMFIDEGFGSLDEHSRNQAVKVLQEMADGSRLIGIISHVSELKQEIEDQLIVTKDENGSHVKWQIS